MSNKLLRAVEDGQTDWALELIRSGDINVNECGSSGQAALHDAAAQGYADVVDALVEAGANVNVSDEDGMKPLHNAARKGHDAIVTRLIEAGANINDINTDGLTPLHFAAHRGHIKVVDNLLGHKARVAAADNYEDLPLHFAASEGHCDVIRMLLQKGSPIAPQTNRGNTPLHLAAMKGKVAAVKLLLERGSPHDKANFANLTAVQVAENKSEHACAQAIKAWVEEDEARRSKMAANAAAGNSDGAPPMLRTAESELHMDPGAFISPLSSEPAAIQRGMSTMDLSNTANFCMVPAPKGTVVQGIIIREKKAEGLFYTYYLQNDEATFLLTASKKMMSATSNYPISTHYKYLDRKDAQCLGKLRGNRGRTQYVIYDDGENPKGAEGGYRSIRKELGVISYTDKFPRNIVCLIPGKKVAATQPGELDEFHVWQPKTQNQTMLEVFNNKRQRYEDIWVLQSKKPEWYPEVAGYVLDFYGRVTQKSSKNFQLVYADPNREDTVLLLFGRTEKDGFTMDFQHPLTTVQAFGICLTAFDTT